MATQPKITKKLTKDFLGFICDSHVLKNSFPKLDNPDFLQCLRDISKVVKTMKSKLYPKHEYFLFPKLLMYFDAMYPVFKREIIAWFSFHHCCLIWHHASLQFIITASLLLIIIIMVSILIFQSI